ncbi:MAG: cbb3-type cytochrome oxidase assembly protein [Spirochaetes bacterium]|jgi:hypothetical protein|nr:cbb3-type cytochrome oxidase assembly protein [Spirochaetota bacterium]
MKKIILNFAKEFEADIKSIPATIERRESKKAAAFLIVFSIIFTGFPLVALAWALRTGQYDPRMLYVAIPFPVIGIVVLLYGMNLGIRKTAVDIGYDEVRYFFTSLFKSVTWTEPRAAYRGILLRKQMRGDQYYNIIELLHDRGDRRIELAVYMMNLVPEAYVRERWEDYSRRFGLSALRETADGVTSRASADASSPLRDVPPEDALPSGALSAPPAGIALVSSPGVEELLVTAKRTLRPGLVVLMALAALLVWIGFFSQDDPSINFLFVGGFGALLWAWLNLYTMMDLFTMQSLRFGADKVILSRKTPFGHTSGKSLYAGQIKDVRVDTGTVHRVNALIIETGDADIQMGHGLPLSALRWMRDFTIENIRSS